MNCQILLCTPATNIEQATIYSGEVSVTWVLWETCGQMRRELHLPFAGCDRPMPAVGAWGVVPACPRHLQRELSGGQCVSVSEGHFILCHKLGKGATGNRFVAARVSAKHPILGSAPPHLVPRARTMQPQMSTPQS